MKESEIVDMVSRKLTPYILLLGLYLVSFGHLSPGGGFQGGAVLATGIIQLALARGVRATTRVFPLRRFSLVETAGFFLFLLIGTVGMLAGLSFLGIFLPTGTPGRIPSAGFIFFLNLIIGMKVAAGMSLICLTILKEQGT